LEFVRHLQLQLLSWNSLFSLNGAKLRNDAERAREKSNLAIRENLLKSEGSTPFVPSEGALWHGIWYKINTILFLADWFWLQLFWLRF